MLVILVMYLIGLEKSRTEYVRYCRMALKPFALRGAVFRALLIASALDVARIRMNPYLA